MGKGSITGRSVTAFMAEITAITTPLSDEGDKISLLTIDPEEADSGTILSENETKKSGNSFIMKMIAGTGVLLLIGAGIGVFVSSVEAKRHHNRSVDVDLSNSELTREVIYPELSKNPANEDASYLGKSKATKQSRKSNKKSGVDSSVADKLSYEVMGPAKAYNRKFISTWWGMMRQLWTADGGANGIHKAIPTSVINYIPHNEEKPYRTPQLVAHWTSPDCKFLDLNLKHLRTLQDGNSNQVLLMKDVKTQNRYVIKTISNPDAFYNELTFFMFINPKHPYFSRAVCNRRVKKGNGVSTAKVVFEYVNGVESLDYARSAEMPDLKRITAQLFLAMEHMHYLKYIHADLKPHNVLVDVNGNVKVIDFGFSSKLPYAKKAIGTHFTMAPELHDMVPGLLHEGVDWWAYGSTVAMWFGAYYDEKRYKAGHDGKDSGRTGHRNTCILMNWTDEKVFEAGSVPSEFPESLRSFLFMFFSADPDTRLFNTPRLLNLIRNHEFFEGINWSELHGGEFGKLYPASA